MYLHTGVYIHRHAGALRSKQYMHISMYTSLYYLQYVPNNACFLCLSDTVSPCLSLSHTHTGTHKPTCGLSIPIYIVFPSVYECKKAFLYSVLFYSTQRIGAGLYMHPFLNLAVEGFWLFTVVWEA